MSAHIPAELRALVRERASKRCEYCLIHEDDVALRHQPDHIIARKHGGLTTAENMAYSCALCNSFKGSDIASVDIESGLVVRLFNPRIDDWHQHFRRLEGSILSLTPEGRATARVLQFNRPDLVQLRQLSVAAEQSAEKRPPSTTESAN
jgi:hypothetical protein